MGKHTSNILRTKDLYKLALCLSNAEDYQTNLKCFLKTLRKKKQLTYCSVWRKLDEESEEYKLFAAFPSTEAKSFENKAKENYTRNSFLNLDLSKEEDPLPEGLNNYGALAIIPLSQYEILKIYDAKRGDVFSTEELDQLKPVLKSLAHLLKAYLTHQRYENELIEKSHNASKLGGMIDVALDAFIIIDDDGQITEWNPMAEKIFGWKKEEILGKKMSETIVPEEYRLTYKRIIQRFLRTGKSNFLQQRIEIKAQNKQGESFPIEFSIVPVKGSAGYSFCSFVRDITLSKQEEEKQKELFTKLEIANRDLKDFAYVVSHDLKAPLRAIKELSEWISLDYADNLGPEGKQQFDLLKARVDRMKDLINGILEYSQIGLKDAEESIVDLDYLIRDILEMLAPPPHILIKLKGRFPKLLINEAIIRQLFQNLISNAIKYIDKDVGKIIIGTKEEEDHFCFWVQDNGPGIERKDFDKIFKIFETLDQKKTYNSTGVGLAIVKKIVKNLGGKIGVESTPGQGACFYFSLPKLLKEKALPSSSHINP